MEQAREREDAPPAVVVEEKSQREAGGDRGCARDPGIQPDAELAATQAANEQRKENVQRQGHGPREMHAASEPEATREERLHRDKVNVECSMVN